ncbi:tetraspanin-14 isoform X2 [Pelecanus crispus]|uniref:tetraspanin-14 isoform X2 n=1 Tax=Pelecanus crispus TaxID=36300 RepID=UPI003F5D04A2
MHYYRYSNAEVSCWYKYLLFSYNIVFWGWGLNHFSGQPVPMLGHSFHEEIFSNSQSNSPLVQLEAISSCPITSCLAEETDTHLTTTPFQLAGMAFLAAGLWAWSEKGVLSDLTKVTGLHGLDPVVLVLVVGIVMFTLGFAGCVGALRENICLLKFFCGTIVFIFLLEVAVVVLAFLFQDWVRDRVKEFFENNIKSYRDDIDLQNLIDSLQKINHCCGAQGPDDWDFNVYFNCSSESKSREKCGVPFSCCIPDPAQKVVNTQCGYDVRKKSKRQWDDQIFVKGCILALEAWLPRNIYVVAGVFIAISLLQIFGIFLARTLISDIEAVKAGGKKVNCP